MSEISHPKADQMTERGRRMSLAVFLVVIAVGMLYVALHLISDLQPFQQSVLPYFLLALALLIALGFEFVNGFHDTANAVATVIYTHSLAPNFAVVWSGTWNFLGVLTSSGAVAFGILQLLPVELILQVGSSGGFAMVFALLIAAIIWNLGTWYFGLPSSSSHTLIGSIIGVGLMNQMMHGPTGTSGVDWGQALGVGKSLLFSPVIGFIAAGLLLLILKAVVRIPALYKEPVGKEPAFLDPLPADPDLHGRVVRARFQRRSKRHGSHHADPDRHGADRLRTEQGRYPRRDTDLRIRRPGHIGHACEICKRRADINKSAWRCRTLRADPPDHAVHRVGFAAADGADRPGSECIGFAR